MMKPGYKVLLSICVGVSLLSNAQQKQEDVKKLAKPKPIPAYLGNSDKSSGVIQKKTFDELIKQGLTSKDSTGKLYKVDGFLLTFAERNLYEDSVGQLMWVTDFLSEVCYGDSLTTFLKGILLDRTKKGDTVYFDELTVRAPDGKNYKGKSMKFIIDK